jgi:hypothetical protein
LDTVVDQHYNTGIHLLITLKCNSEWGTISPGGPGTTASSFPKNMSQYERFVSAITSKYADKVKYWQIENEVYEPSKYWNGTKEEYIQLLQHAHDTIKQIDPTINVVLQGFSSLIFILINQGNETLRDFFEYILEEGQNYFDIVDFHQYWEPETVYNSVELLKETMHNFGYEKEIICTEAGDLDIRLFHKHLSNPEDPIPIIQELLSIPAVQIKIYQIISDGIVTEEEFIDLASFLKNHWRAQPILERYQAETLVKRIGLTLSQGIKQIYWLGMKETEASASIDWFWTMMPLISENGRKKPHYYTYKILIDKLKEFTSVDEIVLQSDIKIIRFNITREKTVFIAWSDSECNNIDLSSYITTPSVIVTHIITEKGKTDEHAEIKIVPTSEIKITKTPIFIELLGEQYVDFTIKGGVGCTFQVKNNGDEHSIVYWECFNQPFFRNRTQGKRSGDIQNPPGSRLSDRCITLRYIGRVTAMITDGNQTMTRSGLQIFPFVIFVD